MFQIIKNNYTRIRKKYYYENGKVASESYYDNGVWNGKDYREYDEEGKIRIKIENKGYGTKYMIYDENGISEPMNDEQIAELLKRIDQREQEEIMSRNTPAIRKLF